MNNFHNITLTKPHDEKSLKTLMKMSDLEISELYKDYRKLILKR